MTEITKRSGREPTIPEETEPTEESSLTGQQSKDKKKVKKKSLLTSFTEIGREVYNSEFREFLGRDAKAWFKLSLFYFLFYTGLAFFFIGLLFLFFQSIDMKTPNYFNKESVMNFVEVNPGMGFRPQVDIESELIMINPTENKNNYQSLDLFMSKYESGKKKNFTGAHGRKQIYNYEEFVNNTPCARDKHFGYLPNSQAPCVLLKLNRIYGWLPIYGKAPGNVSRANTTDKFVYVKCEGEHGTDRDNIKEIEYYSAYPSKAIGGIPLKYFPYRNQPDYLSPLVFAYFKNVSTNVLINVECKAYAKNINNKDRVNRRGMTKFQLFINSK